MFKHSIFYILLFAVLLSSTVFGQRNISLSGIVTELKSGKPLAGATVTIHDTKITVVSKENGTFIIHNLATGKYLIEVSFVGFSTEIETINLTTSTTQNFTLKEAVAENESVTVTGVSSAMRIKQSPQPVTILKHNDIIKTSSTNIINSITHIAGVSALTTGAAISKPFIRGLGYNRVLTVNDGVRQEGQQWGDEHGIEIDDYSVQRIEVLKGPASIMYGSDALAGVINMQSLIPAAEGNIIANVLSEYQTTNKLRGFYGNVSGTKKGLSFNVYGSYKGAADYKNKYDGYVFNSKFYNKNFGGMIGSNGSWGHSYLNISNFDQHIGMIEGDRDAVTGKFIKADPGGTESIATSDDFNKIKPFVPYQHVQHFKVASDNSFNVGRNKLSLTLGYQHNQRREFGNPDEITIPDAFFDLQTFTYSTKFAFVDKHNFKTSVGVSGMYQTNKNKAEETLIPDYNLFDVGGFVYTQYSKNKLSVSGGLRFDNRHIDSKLMNDGIIVKFDPFTKDFSNVSGSAGLSYQANKQLSLKLNIARGFRAPSLSELTSNGAHEGTNRFEIGSKDLKSEKSLQVDVGIELNTPHVSFTANAFYNNITDFIFSQKVLNSAGSDSMITNPDNGDLLIIFKFNQQTAHLYGAEFNIDIHPHPLDWLHFENTFSYTRAEFAKAIDGSKNVPFIPAARLISELKGNFLSKGKSLRNLYVSIESDYTFKQSKAFTGYNTETATGDYWLMNAAIGTDIVSKNKTLFSIHFTANNLGDVAYQNHLSRLKYTAVNNATGRQGVFNPGRNFGVKVNVPLTFNWN